MTDKFPLVAGAQAPPDPLHPEAAPARSERSPSQEELQKAFAHPLAPEPPKAMDIAARRAARVDEGQPEGFTKLFNPAPGRGPLSPPLNTSNYPMGEVAMGPSDFTRVINASELRSAGQPSAAANVAAGPPPAPSGMAPPQAAPQPVVPQYQVPQVPQYQMPPQAPMPQYAPPQVPGQVMPQYGAPAPQGYFPPAPQMTPPGMPGFQPPPVPQAPPVAGGSKWIAYLPVIIVINILFMLAVLLVVFFALKK